MQATMTMKNNMKNPTFGFQRFVELKRLSYKFFFDIPYEIFILKNFSALDNCYFKAAEAINPEPKRIEYLIYFIYKPFVLLLLFN